MVQANKKCYQLTPSEQPLAFKRHYAFDLLITFLQIGFYWCPKTRRAVQRHLNQ